MKSMQIQIFCLNFNQSEKVRCMKHAKNVCILFFSFFHMHLQIKLVNINASDIVDGRPPVILGLIWTIILYFQIEENTKQMYAGSDSQNQFSSVAGGADPR